MMLNKDMNDISKKLADIEKSISAMRRNLATKEDLKNLETRVNDNLSTGLKNLETKLLDRIEQAQMEIVETVDKHKADKDNVKVFNSGLPPFTN